MLWLRSLITPQEPYNSVLNDGEPEQRRFLPSRTQPTTVNSSLSLPSSVSNTLDLQGSQGSLAAVAVNNYGPPVSLPPNSDLRLSESSRGLLGHQEPILNSTTIQTDMSTELRQPKPDCKRRSPQAAPTVKPFADMPENLTTDLYTYNSLNSFSFGSVQPQAPSSSSRSIHPFSTSHTDTDSIGEDSSIGPPDVTPRPSVVAYDHPDQRGSHPAQPQRQQGVNQSKRTYNRGGRNTDNDGDRSGRESDASSHTGVSSASASVTSLSSTSAGFSRTGSRTSHHTNTTNLTSAAHSSTDDTDDEYDHHHPFPPHIGSRSAVSSSTGDGSNTAVEFSSDEEYGDSEYDYDFYEASMNIEIGSAQYEGSVVTHDWERDFYAGAGGSNGSIRGQASFGYSERRGSIPIAIPGVVGPLDMGDTAMFVAGRNREDSLTTIRRPSRSLDDDFAKSGFSWAAAPRAAGQPVLDHPLERSPVSVPGSDADWKVLEERTKSKGKARETDEDVILSSLTISNGMQNQPLETTPGTSIAPMDGFDLDWAQMKDGITVLDPGALGDIIGSPNPVLSSNERRSSAAGGRWLFPWGTRDARRPSTATVSSYVGDSFGKAIRSWDGDRYQAQRRDWSFRREKADGTADGAHVASGRQNTPGFLSPRGSIVTERHGAPLAFIGERERELPKEIERDKPTPSTPWKGMRLNSQELWRNDLVGRFKVDRRATRHTDESKGLQQRLVIQPIKDPYIQVPPNGPIVTIHKHSKAIAFSISRHFRPPRRRNDVPPTSSRATDATLNTLMGSSPIVPAPKRSSSNMILLAPRRVQVAYTSTNTTRKLESHGLLDDTVTGNSTEAKEKEKLRRQKERERQKPAPRDKSKEKERPKTASEDIAKSKGKGKQQTMDDTYMVNRSGPHSQSLPAPPTSAPSPHTYPPSSSGSSSSLVNREATSSERTVSRNVSHLSRRRRRARDPLEDDDDDEDDENAAPTRTPHSEAFGTMDATLIEQLRQDRSHNGESDRGIWNRLLGRSNHSATASPGQLHAPFVAPWLALQPRNKQESHRGAINTLNDSFKDVGLLPSNYNASRHSVPTSQRQKKVASSSNNNDPFRDIPEDSLYMLLPLWPGVTDSRSETSPTSFERPVILNDQRQFLLVYYKVPPEATEEDNRKTRGTGDSKKRSMTSPTSSHESGSKRDDRASVLLSSFHITARLVPYHKLQGTGVRVPDEGLTVTGPLDVAFEQRPPPTTEESYYEYVVGICHSREAGIEFYPDGLVKMGLCLETSTPMQTPTSEEDEPPEPDIKLTPIGRAVLEMVWLGALALTSFGPGA